MPLSDKPPQIAPKPSSITIIWFFQTMEPKGSQISETAADEEPYKQFCSADARGL